LLSAEAFFSPKCTKAFGERAPPGPAGELIQRSPRPSIKGSLLLRKGDVKGVEKKGRGGEKKRKGGEGRAYTGPLFHES